MLTYTWDISSGDKRYMEICFGGTGGNNPPIAEENIQVIFNGCTSVSGNVVTYTVNGTDVAVTVAGAAIEYVGDNYQVNVPRNNMSSVTFTVDNAFNAETMKVALHGANNFGAELSLSDHVTSLAAHTGGLADWVNLEVEPEGGPGPGEGGGEDASWYTVSWAGGNVTVENGEVLAERVHVAAHDAEPAKTYTAIESEYSASAEDDVYSLWDTIGATKEQLGGEQDALQKFGLGFAQSDLFIQKDLGGVSIDFKFVPKYGYQLKNIYTNEEQKDSFLNAFTTDDNHVSAFTFDVSQVNQNVHFCVYFEAVSDTVSTSGAAGISGAAISNGGNAAASGNLALTVADTTTDTSIQNAVGTVNLTLDNVVSKGGDKGSWTTNITEFDNPITVTLTLDKTRFTDTVYSVVREHDGVKETLTATYDPATGALTFPTNRFSAYTIVARAPGSITPPTAKTGLVYNGTAQTLIHAGSSTTGTVQYKLGAKGTYGTDIPTATAAGTYTVYYRVLGDAEHQDVAEAVVTVTIAEDFAPVLPPDTPTRPANENKVDTDTVKAELRDGTVTVSEVKLEAVESGKAVSLDFSESKEPVEEVQLPGKALKAISEASGEGMAIKLTEAEIKLDADALKTITAALDDKKLSLSVKVGKEALEELTDAQSVVVAGMENVCLINASITADGKAIPDFGDGTVQLAVEFPWNGEGVLRAAFVSDDGTVEIVPVTFENGRATLSVRHFSSYAVYTEDTLPFADVTDPTEYYYDAVKWAIEKNITTGTDAAHFSPMEVCTRGQMITFLWRAAGCPEPGAATCQFADVEADAYYYKAVLWALESGVTTGTSDTTFSPEASVSRSQTVTFLARMNGVKDDAAGYSHSFTDVIATDYFNNAVAWAYANKITLGIDTTEFSPADDCLRCQIVTFLYRSFAK